MPTWLIWVVTTLAALVALVFMAGGADPKVDERYKERTAIALCWKEHERKSLDAGTKRFVASTCEMMERDFAQKHGRSP